MASKPKQKKITPAITKHIVVKPREDSLVSASLAGHASSASPGSEAHDSGEEEEVTNRMILNEIREYRQEIKAEIAKTNRRVGEAEQRISDNEDKMQVMEEVLTELLGMHERTQEKLTDYESRSRRGNVRIYGIPEGMEKSPKEMIPFIEKVLKENLGISAATDMQIERAHRALGPPPPLNAKPRSIVIKFQSYRMKEEVIRLAWQKKGFDLAGHKISIDNDYAPAVLEKRKEYAETRRALKANNIRFQTLFPACLRVHYEYGPTTYDSFEDATADVARRGINVKVIERPASLRERVQRGAWQTACIGRSNAFGKTPNFEDKLQASGRALKDNTS